MRFRDVAFRESAPPAPRRVKLATLFHRPRGTASARESRERFAPPVPRAAARGASVVCLPEGITIVGTALTYAGVAEPVPGPTTAFLGELARRHRVWIVAGLYERDGARVYNTAVLVSRDGTLAGRYRKMSLPDEEIEGGITPGADTPVFDTDFGRVGLMICWDSSYPEVARAELAYHSVARELVRQAGPGIAVHALNETRAGQGALLRTLSRAEVTTVIAVGLPAAQFTRRLAGNRVVFCQVYNYDEAGLPASGVRGVSALPPLAEPFRLWKAIDPRLDRIGVITGPRLAGVVAEARAAARAAGLELVHVEVSSDKETLYAFRRLLPRIQGLWLVPDNRVLSAGVIRDVLAQAVREGRQVLGFQIY